MSNSPITTTTEFGKVFSQIDQKLDKIDNRKTHLDKKFEVKLDQLEEKFEAQFNQLDRKTKTQLDKFEEKIDRRLDKMDERFYELDKHLKTPKFVSRSVLVGLIVTILEGLQNFLA